MGFDMKALTSCAVSAFVLIANTCLGESGAGADEVL